MLVSLIVYEPAAFQLSRDGVIKQMGCDAVDHKPDDPRGIRHGVLLRFAPRYRGKKMRRIETRWPPPGWSGWRAARQREPGIDAGLQVFSVALGAWWQDAAARATARRATSDQ